MTGKIKKGIGVVLWRRWLISLILPLCLLVTGCAHLTDTRDPFEPYNRAMFTFNDHMDQMFLRPVAIAYKNHVPNPVKTAVRNVLNNGEDVISIFSHLLQFKLQYAVEDFMRVTVNSVFGLGGLINWADAAQMPNHKASLADAMISWGWEQSYYLILPFAGPSTVRDSIGDVGESWWGRSEWFYLRRKMARDLATLAVEKIDQRAMLTDAEFLLDAQQDRYAYLRDFYLSSRGAKKAEDDIDIDDLVDFDLDDTEVTSSSSETPVLDKKTSK